MFLLFTTNIVKLLLWLADIVLLSLTEHCENIFINKFVFPTITFCGEHLHQVDKHAAFN